MINNNNYNKVDFSNDTFSTKSLQHKNFEEEDENIQVKPEHLSKKEIIFKKIKRGKKKTKIQKYKRTHTKHTSDNILRKIQVHYLSFIVDYLNEILKSCSIKEQFLKFDYRLKKLIKKDVFEYLKNRNIGDIICFMKISHKYKQYNDENYNKRLYNNIKENKLFNKILSENYLTLFKKIYYTNKRIINLNEYGLNKEIILSDRVKTYKDLLLKNSDDKKNQKNINECIIQKFLPNSIFLVNYL